MVLRGFKITKSFGGHLALDSVDFEIKEKEIFGLVGPNGAGKTTLLNVITGFLKPEKGHILFKDREITGLRPDQICKLGINRTFQIPHCFPNLTVKENIMIALMFGSSNSTDVERKIKELAELCGISSKLNNLASNLNTSELKRLDLARALATNPRVLLLDEFHTGLNVEQTKQYMEILDNLREEGLTLVVVEHNMRVITYLCDRCMVLDYGKKIAEGPPNEIIKDQRVLEAYIGQKIL